MGLLDNIAKKAKETAAAASKAYDDAAKSIKEKTIGELVDSVIDAGSKAISNTSDFVSTKASEIKTNVENLTMEDVGNYAKDMGKLVSGVTAYENRKAANEKKEKADKIMEETTRQIEQVRFLANTRLETFGRARCEILKTTVGRFIKIIESLNNNSSLIFE